MEFRNKVNTATLTFSSSGVPTENQAQDFQGFQTWTSGTNGPFKEVSLARGVVCNSSTQQVGQEDQELRVILSWVDSEASLGYLGP